MVREHIPDLLRIKQSFITQRWDFYIPSNPELPQKLSKLLEILLPHLTLEEENTKSWQDRINWGGVFINGKDVLCDRELNFPCRIEYYEPKFNTEDPHSIFPRFNESRIVHKDDSLLVYSKPSGLPCVPAREQKVYNLRYYLETLLSKPIHMPSRLDVSTYGLVPVSLNKDTHHALQLVYQHRKVKKIYLFRCMGKPSWQNITINKNIAPHPSHPVLRTWSDTEGKTATTKLELVYYDKNSNSSLIKAMPITGRTHQIRVHALFAGVPIIGDNFYGNYESIPIPNKKVIKSDGYTRIPNEEPLNLICYSLKFPHPKTEKNFEIKVPIDLLPNFINPELLDFKSLS